MQASLYEGYTVWINALIAGAGGQIVENPGAIAKDLKLGLDTTAGRPGRRGRHPVAGRAERRRSGALVDRRAAALALFEAPATSAFLTNWPYVWSAMKADGVKSPRQRRRLDLLPARRWPASSRSPPFGGIELGIGKFGAHKAQAWEAAQCITQRSSTRLEYMVNTGNPAANTQVYTDPAVLEGVPERHGRRRS